MYATLSFRNKSSTYNNYLKVLVRSANEHVTWMFYHMVDFGRLNMYILQPSQLGL